MPERTVAVGLVANVSNYLAGMAKAKAGTADLGKQAQTSGELTRAFVSKIGGSISSLGNQIGGGVGMMLDAVGSGMDKVASKSAHLGTALEVGGGAAVAAGLALQQLGSGEVQATQQLDAAITSAGDSVSDFTKKIDDAVATNENFGKSAEDTKDALRVLTTATGSTQTALNNMQVVANLAAAKHVTLADAASQVARVLAGSGGRTLAQYGIQMDGVGTKTQQGTRAVAELATKLDGQATAAVNNFAGQVGVAKTHVEDWVNEMAGPAGQVLVGLGAAANVAGIAIDIYRARAAAAAAAQIAMNAAAGESVAPLEAEGVAAMSAGNSLKGMRVAGAAGGVAIGATLAIAAAEGASALGTLTDAAVRNKIVFKDATDASAAYNKQVQLINTTTPADSATKRAAALQETLGLAGSINGAFASIGLGGLAPEFESANASITKIDASLSSLVAGGHLKEAADEYSKWSDAAKKVGISQDDLQQEFPSYISALSTYSDSTGTAANKTVLLNGDFGNAAVAAANLKTATDALETSLKTYGSAAFTAESATEAYYSALDAATKAAKDNGKATSDQTAAGRANNQALYALAQAADAVAAANLKNKVPLDQVREGMVSAQAQFIKTAESMGYTAQQAEALAKKLIDVPKKLQIEYDAHGAQVATGALDVVIGKLKTINSMYINFSTKTGQKGNPFIHTGGAIEGGRVAHFATGGGYGLYRGPGSGTSDSIPAMVSNGEYVNSASTVARLGVNFFQGLNRGGWPAHAQTSAAPVAAISNTYLSVPVTISGAVVGDANHLAQVLTNAVKTGIKNGVISANWQDRN